MSFRPPLGELLSPEPPRKSRRPWLLLLALLALLGGLALYDITNFAVRVRRFSKLALDGNSQLTVPVSDGEAIVVLTGDHGRIPRALELLRTRGSPLLVISGTRRGITLTELVNQQGGSTVDIHKIWKKIVVESVSASTLENAVESGKICKSRGVQSVILVTSDYHMERSLQIFEAIAPGPKYYAYPTASEVAELRFALTPGFPAALWKLGVEYGKYLLYRHYQSRFVTAMRP